MLVSEHPSWEEMYESICWILREIHSEMSLVIILLK